MFLIARKGGFKRRFWNSFPAGLESRPPAGRRPGLQPFSGKANGISRFGQYLGVGNEFLGQGAVDIARFLQTPDVLSGQNGAAGGTASRGVAKGMRETNALPRHPVESRSLDHRVPVGSRVGIGLIVRDANKIFGCLAEAKGPRKEDKESLCGRNLFIAELVLKALVEVGFDLDLVGSGRVHSILGNLQACGPKDGVQHDLAVSVVLPTDVVVPPGEAEATASVLPFVGPGNGCVSPLATALRTAGLPLRIPSFLRRVSGRRDVGQDGGESGPVLHEAHVIVPFVIHAEGLDAIPDRVFLRLEIGLPVGIDRPVQIAESAHPFEKPITGRALHRLRRPMNHDDTRSLFHESIKFLELGVENVSTVPRAKDHDGGGILQNGGIFRVSHVLQNDRLDRQAGLVQPLGQGSCFQPGARASSAHDWACLI